jgi:phosphosulfolactate phosphohydrolase-like enzyme
MSDIDELVQRLISHAQNEEMIDQCLTDHGKDCVAAANVLERQQRDLKEAVELLRKSHRYVGLVRSNDVAGNDPIYGHLEDIDAFLARVKP